MRVKSLAGVLMGLIVPASALWLVLNQQAVYDWWRLRSYDPPVEIAKLAADADMTDEGRRLFYLQYPELLEKRDFSDKCAMGEETIVLGCYISGDRIYIFNVNEEKLAGIEEVTAAHEMLHAVYDRLDSRQKDRLNLLLNDTFNSLNDKRLEETISNYNSRDPSIVSNELHSILGTEVKDLPQELEDHYSQYFNDRGSVVAKAQAYAAEFAALEERIAIYDAELEALEARIETEKVNIEQLNQALLAERAQLDSLLPDPSAYNAAIAAYNQKVREYNRQLEQLRSDISEYNRIVEERNNIAIEERRLVDAINSSVVSEE